MKDISRMTTSTRLLVETGLRRGLDITVLSAQKNTWLLRLGSKEYVWKATAFCNPTSSTRICDDKELTHQLLGHWGYRVPASKVFASTEKEECIAWTLQQPAVVMKPLDSAHGWGVTVLPEGKEEIAAAWEEAQRASPKLHQVLVEECVEGQDYRLMVFMGTFLYVMKREPAHVVGDGQLNVQELIDRENSQPLRGATRYSNIYSPIECDALLLRNLKRRGYTLESIPPVGEKVALRKVCNTGKGGTSTNVTAEASVALQNEAIALADRLGLDILAIDVHCSDLRPVTSLREVPILELNATPGITLGTESWVIEAAWDAILLKLG